MALTIIIDLDKTVIDSAHRYRTKANGDIDLDYWFANAHKAANDSLLPFAIKWRQMQTRTDCVFVVCTSRVESAKVSTLEFLAANGLRVNHYLCRPSGSNLPCEELKVNLLRRFFSEFGGVGISPRHAVMIEDHKGVRDAVFKEFGIMCLNPIASEWLTPSE